MNGCRYFSWIPIACLLTWTTAAGQEARILLPTSEETAQTWVYTTGIPNFGWHLIKFDHTVPFQGTEWQEGAGGFGSMLGTKGLPGVNVGAEWDTNNIWLRRTFQLETVPKNPHLRIRHDEHAEIYINGQTAAKLAGYNKQYQLVPLSRLARKTLKVGENFISVHCHQTTGGHYTSGGQYIDVGIVDLPGSPDNVEPPSDVVTEIDPGKPWPKEKVWQWYRSRPPIRGCNYLPRSAVNTVEMWQRETFDPKTIDQELGWAEDAGYNSVRVFLQFAVWEADPEGFLERLDQFLTIADRHGIDAMPIFFDDCCFNQKLEPVLGKQDEPVPGIINSGWVPSPGYSMVLDRATWPRLKQYVDQVVGRFRNDKRVLVWDTYNEPGPFFDRTTSFALAKAGTGWIRQHKPIQPVTVAVWGNPQSKQLLEFSDVLSIHTYSGGGDEFFSDTIKKFDRPILCTEWLVHGGPAGVEAVLPIFAKYHVGWYNWGLVAGRTQCYYYFGMKKGTPMLETWMCDIFWPDGRPYDPKEIALIRKFEFAEADPRGGAPQ